MLACVCCCRVSDNAAEMHKCTDAALHQLTSLWDQIGIVGEQRVARYGVVLTHVRALMEDMVQEETVLRDRLVASINKLHSEITQLCTEMNLPQYEVYCSMLQCAGAKLSFCWPYLLLYVIFKGQCCSLYVACVVIM